MLTTPSFPSASHTRTHPRASAQATKWGMAGRLPVLPYLTLLDSWLLTNFMMLAAVLFECALANKVLSLSDIHHAFSHVVSSVWVNSGTCAWVAAVVHPACARSILVCLPSVA